MAAVQQQGEDAVLSEPLKVLGQPRLNDEERFWLINLVKDKPCLWSGDLKAGKDDDDEMLPFKNVARKVGSCSMSRQLLTQRRCAKSRAKSWIV